MPRIAVAKPYRSFDPGGGLPVVPATGVDVTSQQEADIRAAVEASRMRGLRIIEWVGDIPVANNNQLATRGYIEQMLADLEPKDIGAVSPDRLEKHTAPGFQALPGTMTAPPTITIGAPSGSSSIASARTVEPDAAGAIRFVGTVPTRGTVYPNTLFLASNRNGIALTSLNGHPCWYAEFDHDGSVVEFITRGTAAGFRIMVNGQFTGPAQRNSATADGQFYPVKIDFGSRAMRRIRLEVNGNFEFGKFFIEPTASMWATPRIGPRVCFIGDSFTEPTISDTATATVVSTGHEGWATICSRLLGWHDRYVLGSGSTGYLTSGTPGRVKFRDRVQNDVIARNPDIVVVAGGINDSAYTPAQLGAEAALLYEQIRAGLPGARLYVLSPFFPRTPDAAILARSDALKAEALKVGAAFIDTLVPSIITGSGKQGSPNGSGNAEVYTGADGTHPTFLGHEHLGRRVATLIHAISI